MSADPAVRPASQDPYLDAKRFPWTTQPGLDLHGQKMIDAVNKDDIRRLMEEGKPIPADLQAIWREFEEKEKLSQGPLPPAPGSEAA